MSPVNSVPGPFRTIADKFGLTRLYNRRPRRIPDVTADIEERLDRTFPPAAPLTPNHNATATEETQSSTPPSEWFPLPNYSAFRVAHWFWNSGATVSKAHRDELLEILRDPGFLLDDLLAVKDWEKVQETLSKAADGSLPESNVPYVGDGWRVQDVTITVPFARQSGASQPSIPYTMPRALHSRSIVAVIQDVFANDPNGAQFHFEPFRQYWTDPANPSATEERVYSEMWTSDAFLAAHDAIQVPSTLPQPPIPRVVAALMFASDSTHLAQFGTAKMWPLYMAFGNQSKYQRAEPSERAMHHVGFLPSVSFASLCT